MNAPIDPSISDLLRGSSLAPMMDQPVSHILHSMGLPQLPAIPPMPPLPGLPPMPVIDLTAIVRPLTDMASSFGTGQFGGAGVHPAVGVAPAPAPTASNPVNSPAAQNNSAAPQASKPQAAAPQPATPGAPAGNNAAGSPTAAQPNVDPTQVLTAITTGLQTAMQLGMSALQVVMQMWQGQGAQQAASTGTQAQASGSQLATQSTGQKAILGAGATSVFTGGALMATVMGKYMTTMALTAPALSVPGGAAFMVAETAEAIAEALAVITKTRVELTIHSANMTEAGQKVEVSSTPTGVNAASQASTAADTAAASSSSSTSELQQLMQMISPVGQLLTTGVQSATQLGEAAKTLIPGVSATPTAASVSADKTALGAYKGSDSKSSAAGGGAAGGAGGVAAVPATPLTPYIGTQLAGGSTFGPGGAAAAEALAAEPVATSTPMSASSPMVPMAGAGAAAAAARGIGGAGDADGGVNSNLVTGVNGDEVVGDLNGATLPVVGAYVRAVEAPPDKELTL
ncbi:hypothetical protein K7711_01860 [Nocardia sp. CA2R105]|uniref:hypothetical protein n=1 Tax=Nocardia coffeae TaxID=2873381 RepID=UPI001CA62CE2|nr:hypothetical protein [Nocardia coffeae]MBY8855216.1 hypothetical protein [Nocardia coffeae]